MSVVQDRLMTQAPENRPKAQASRADKSMPERDSTAFSELYARERATLKADSPAPAKRSEVADKPKQPVQSDAKEPAQEQASVEESGKDLPLEEMPPQTDEQTLQWLGLDTEEESSAVLGLPEAAALLGVTPQQLPPANNLPVALGQSSGELELSSELTLEGEGEALKKMELVLADEQQGVSDDSEPELVKQPLEKIFALKPLVEEISSQNIRSNAVGGTEAPTDSSLNRLASMAPPQVTPTQLAKAMPLVPGQPVPMQQAGWSDAVVDRVMWLSSQNLKSAEIQLDPAELGRLEVRISLNQESTQITFASLNANVRDALESQMHRLRDLFAQQGMNQLDVNVSDQSLQRGSQEANQTAGSGRGQGEEAVNDELDGQQVQAGMTPIRQGLGLVDYYA